MINATFEEGVDRNPSGEDDDAKNVETETQKKRLATENQKKRLVTEKESGNFKKVEDLRPAGEEPSLPSTLAAHYFRQVAASTFYI